jgi:sugar phosphate isomerase/epimerase
MKLGVMTALFSGRKLEDMLKYCKDSGLDAVELCCGNYPGEPFFKVKDLVADAKKRDAVRKTIDKSGLEISALSCHGNPLHPNKEFASANHEAHRNAVALAKLWHVDVVINFSGCPGDSDRAASPNWVTCPWPDDFKKVVDWQWEKKVIPYWKEENKVAEDAGVKLAFEMHPGFVVYNTETLLRLRTECGKTIGANFDPSHLFWQGMDPLVSVKALKGCIWHVHAKDCRIDPQNTAFKGVLDTMHYGRELERSWVFRTVGYGHGYDFWNDFVSILREVGYDGVLSIEHEDSLMSGEEGLQKAIAFLKNVLIRQPSGPMTWA